MMNVNSKLLFLVVLLLSITPNILFAKITNAAPVAICQNFSVQLDALGQATIQPSDINNGSTGCSALTYTLDVSSFTCANVGNNTVTLTVEDVNGMTDFCAATVTVTDPVNPTASCKPATISLDANGIAVLTVADVDNGSNDACGLNFITISKTTFNCGNVGTNTVTLSMSDNNGNISNCQTTVTVQDNILPTAQCITGPLVVNLDATGNANIAVSDIDNGSFDNCGIASLTLDKTSFDCTTLGMNMVELTVVDLNGNTSKCTTMVDVQDTMGPIAMCRDTVLVLSVGGTASLMASQLDDGSTDNCTSPTFSLAQSNFDCTNLGNNTVVFTVTDANGNASTCNTLITIVDQTPPAPVCINTMVTLDAAGQASITPADIDNGTTDECNLNSLTLDKTNFTCLDIGSNTVTLTAVDDSGNSAICTATVTVQENIAPVANCNASFNVQLDVNQQASISTADINNGSSDICGISMMTLDKTSFSCMDIGSNLVTLTVTDNGGNSASCTSTVTVADNFPATAVCSNHILDLDPSGNGIIIPSDIDNVSSNACNFQSASLDLTTFDCSDVGVNPVVLTVTNNLGSTSTCNALVTVRDVTPPVAITQNLIVQLDATGNVLINASQIDNGSTDACGINSMSLNKTSFDCAEVGTNTINFTVVDNNGNSNVATADIIVQDLIPPTVITQNISITLGQGGTASITAADIDNGSSDVCGIQNMTLDKAIFQCANLGANTVVLTVEDNNGNTAIANATVTVLDNITPISNCSNMTVALDANGDAMILPSDLDAGSIGACSGFNVGISQNTFDCSDLGTNFVILTTTNTSNGNSSTCVAIVDVIDNLKPIAICRSITVPLNTLGTAVITASQLNNNSTDNCGIASMQIDQTNFDCTDLGVNVVKFTVTDGTGNADSCFANVTIIDAQNQMPFAKMQRSLWMQIIQQRSSQHLLIIILLTTVVLPHIV